MRCAHSWPTATGRQSPTTLGRKLASLRSFFRFLVREGQREADPSVGIPSAPRRQAAAEPPGSRRLSRPRRGVGEGRPEPALVEAASARVSGGSRCAAGSRAGRAALRGWDPGGRAGGAGRAGHRPASVGDVRVWGKGGKERIVPLPAAARTALREYLDQRRRPGVLAEPLFTSLASLEDQGESAPPSRSPRRASHSAEASRSGRIGGPGSSPPAPAQLCHPPARYGGGPARHPGTPRARQPLHHPEVHGGLCGTPARGL